VRHVCARERDGRWWAPARLRRGELALVARGGVRDGFGQVNGQRSAYVGDPTAAARRDAALVRGAPPARCRR
jgi:hypothetical protein